MTRILCDTHIYFWWVTADRKLPVTAREALENRANEVYVSSVVAWELATKYRLGKWPSARIALDEMSDVIADRELLTLPITLRHAEVAGLFPALHRDPFDRILAAQAEVEDMILATVDVTFEQFKVKVLK